MIGAAIDCHKLTYKLTRHLPSVSSFSLTSFRCSCVPSLVCPDASTPEFLGAMPLVLILPSHALLDVLPPA